MRTFKNHLLSSAWLLMILPLFVIANTGCPRQKEAQKPNILFIAVDDMRPELGCFGASHIVSPNIDRIASEGIIFTNSFCSVPVCGASRASLLTGVRPTETRFVDAGTYADKDLPGHLSLPRYLKDNGYTTISLGKVFHHSDDDLQGWSRRPWDPPKHRGNWRDYRRQYLPDSLMANRPGTKTGPAWEFSECHDTGYSDGKLAVRAIEEMEALSRQDSPFFLAVGFVKPHLPFNCPKKYWDLYEHDQIEVASNPYPPENAPAASIHIPGELVNGYRDVPSEWPLPEEYSRWLRHGYYACVSYIDAQIGKLMETLQQLELEDNTIVIIWGDHGWNLGEHTLWCKHCNFETSLNAPIVIRAPGSNRTGKSDALVEFIDIYPTLVELCGLPIPEHCDGESFVPLLRDPDQPGKEAIYSRYHNGLTQRSERYQFTIWTNPGTQETYARMLFDHQRDPAENINIAELPEYKAMSDSLTEELRDWQVQYNANDQ